MGAGYIIGIRQRMKDKAEMKIYGQKALPTMQGATMDVLYGRHEVLEGDPVDGVVVVHFDTYEAAKEWYESPEYREAIKHRLAGADYQLILVEGV